MKLHVEVEGGDNVDYPDFVLAANATKVSDGRVTLDWAYPSLESGVALGVTLPSVKKYDALAATMASRAFVPALVFLAALSLLSLKNRRPLMFWESYLAAAVFAFSSVLMSYLGAFVHFFLAWAVTMTGLGVAVVLYTGRLFPTERVSTRVGLWVATQVVPTVAVLLPGYTGLIYTLELLVLLLGSMTLLTSPAVRAFLSDDPAGESVIAGGAS